MSYTESSFMIYWRAVNRVLNKHRLPELNFAEAREQWTDAVYAACKAAERKAMLDLMRPKDCEAPVPSV